MGSKVKIIKDTSLIPMDVSSKSEIKTNSGCQATDAFLNDKIDKEITRAKTREDELEEQIKELHLRGFSVKDVVLTYQDLVNYDTSILRNKDVIIVLNDDSVGEGVSTLYRWGENGFTSMGSSWYTVNQIDDLVEAINNRLDYLEDKSSLRNVVLTYQDLLEYNINELVVGDLIAILSDETKSHNSTYYRFNSNNTFDFVGSLGVNYYTKDEIDAKLNAIYVILDDHEIRITDNRTELNNRISESDAYDILVGN